MSGANLGRRAAVGLAGLSAFILLPATAARPAVAAGTAAPTFGNPTISGIQAFGFEQDLRLDTHGRIYTSVPGSLGSDLSYAWRSLDGGQTFKWIPAATQPAGKLPMCNGGGDTELATDSADRLYINDLALANYGTARSADHGRTLTASPACASVLTAPDDRPWYAVDGDPMAGGSITLAYNVAPNATPVPLGNCQVTGNELVFARSPLPGAPQTAGLVFGAPQVLTQACDEGIMGNDEVHAYGSVKRVFAIHNNDALNQIRMARCDIVAVTAATPTGYARCVDSLIFGDSSTVNGGDFPTLTIDRAGNLLALWEQAPCGPCPNTITADTLLYYSVSTTQGDSWSPPRQLPTPGLHTNVFAWPAAGDAGRVDIAWYGTTAAAPFPGNGPCSVSGDWSLYMVQALNFTAPNPTWTQPIVASEHAVHRGSVQTLMGGQTGDRVLGDFLQVRIGGRGEANIAYADSNSDTESLASQGMFVSQNGGSSVSTSAPIVHGAGRRINSVGVGAHPATFDTGGISSTPQPNLEILGSQVSMPNASTYRVRTLVADLTSLAPRPDAGGTTLVWNTQWKVPSAIDPHGGAFFHAYMESVGGGAPSFWVGQNAVTTNGGVSMTYPGSTQVVSGSYTATAPGVITIDVPTADVTEPGAINTLLYSVTSTSMSLTGNAETPPNAFGSGIGGNLFNLVDVAPAYDFNPSRPTPPFTTCHEADGDGTVHGAGGDTASFHFDGDACDDQRSESVDAQDRGSGTDFHSTAINAVTFDDLAHSVTIVGSGVDAGRPVTFTMLALDNGALPGAISLALSDGNAVSGSLLSGGIQLT
jgi:hypothetical protein